MVEIEGTWIWPDPFLPICWPKLQEAMMLTRPIFTYMLAKKQRVWPHPLLPACWLRKSGICVVHAIQLLVFVFSSVLYFLLFFCGICVSQSLVFCVEFGRSLFVLLSFFFWPLHCASSINGLWLSFCFKLFLNKEHWFWPNTFFLHVSLRNVISYMPTLPIYAVVYQIFFYRLPILDVFLPI